MKSDNKSSGIEFHAQVTYPKSEPITLMKQDFVGNSYDVIGALIKIGQLENYRLQ